jgi:hypothetical protein
MVFPFSVCIQFIYVNYISITYFVALGVLSKLVLDEYLANMSKDLLSNHKAFLTKRKPNSGTLWREMGIGNMLKYQISVDPQGNAYSIKNLEKNALFTVNCQESSCTCKAFVKYGYCKHLLFVLKSTNRSSATIDLSSVRTFVYRGNTRRSREHADNSTARANRPQRGRVPNATSALNRM